ncbi:MAG: hypothetical protein GY769_09895 [bacterium]|nr:hypothetical protein [bacterium]
MEFFESPVGAMWLHRVFLAVHWTVEFRGGSGARGVGEFLGRSGLDAFIAPSHGAQRSVAARVEKEIVSCGKTERERLGPRSRPRPISVCLDGTFHPGVCLVGIEPVSELILLERYSEKRDADSWNLALKPALADLPVTVVLAASDEGSGVVACVRRHLGAHHSPDLFHVQQEAGRAFWSTLGRLEGQCQKANERATEAREACAKAQRDWQAAARGPGRPPDFARRLQDAEQQQAVAARELKRAQGQRQEVRDALAGIGDD